MKNLFHTDKITVNVKINLAFAVIFLLPCTYDDYVIYVQIADFRLDKHSLLKKPDIPVFKFTSLKI